MERAEPERARRWGVAALVLLVIAAGFVYLKSSRGPEHDTHDMDRGIERLIAGLASGDREDFIAAQKIFLDVNSGWIVDEYAVFAIQATERLRERVVGPDGTEAVSKDATSPYYRAIANGDLDGARAWARSEATKSPDVGQARSKYMLRFVSDITRVGGEDVVERIRGR